MQTNGVKVLEIDQCEYELKSCDENDFAPAKKPTRFLTNLSVAATALSRLVCNSAAAAQQYPPGLCAARTPWNTRCAVRRTNSTYANHWVSLRP